jgi:hypothetical protein
MTGNASGGGAHDDDSGRSRCAAFFARACRPKRLPPGRKKALVWCGRAGWVGKGVLYALIGGMACESAARAGGVEEGAAPLPPAASSSSPEGAFILLGSTGPNTVGLALLLLMAAGVALYIAWRFSEALAGQGYDVGGGSSATRNVFKYRVSPAVSGMVYCSYMVFLLTAMHAVASSSGKDQADERLSAAGEAKARGWPATWRGSR